MQGSTPSDSDQQSAEAVGVPVHDQVAGGLVHASLQLDCPGMAMCGALLLHHADAVLGHASENGGPGDAALGHDCQSREKQIADDPLRRSQHHAGWVQPEAKMWNVPPIGRHGSDHSPNWVQAWHRALCLLGYGRIVQQAVMSEAEWADQHLLMESLQLLSDDAHHNPCLGQAESSWIDEACPHVALRFVDLAENVVWKLVVKPARKLGTSAVMVLASAVVLSACRPRCLGSL